VKHWFGALLTSGERDRLPGGPTVHHSSPQEERMPLRWEQVIVDAADPVALGRWWATALGWTLVNEDPDEVEIQPTPGQLPGLLFVPVTETKTVKNRLHLDFRPQDRDAEVERLIALGATRVDISQGHVSWVVLADPEGNEFCILSGRPA
jgi:predicted enzyme related to lactoylglutathione lyase